MSKALLLVAATLASGTAVYADSITFQQAPAAVQQTLLSQAGQVGIEHIDRQNRNGQVVYLASWKAGGVPQQVLVSEQGRVLPDRGSVGRGNRNLALANSSFVTFNQTPAAVQKELYSQSSGASIETIEKGTWNGQTIYQAAYTKDGRRVITHVDESGRPLLAPPSATDPNLPRYAGLSPSNVTLSNGSKMDFATAPKAVQNTVTRHSQGSRVEDFERGQWNGRTVYEAAFKKNGQHTELQILEDGSILTEAPRAAAQPPTAATASPFRYAGLASANVPLGSGSKISVNEAPAPVKSTVTQFSGGANVEDFERGQWNGRTVYEAAFKKNGQHIELQVLEDGSILTHAPAGATASGSPASGTVNTGSQP